MDWREFLEKREGGTGGTRKYWLYADGKTSKEARWHNHIHDDDNDEMERGSAKITHDHDGNEGYFGVTLRNHLSDSQRSHINQQIKENRYHQFPKNISFDHGHNNNDTVNSSKKYYPKNQHIAEPKDDDYKNAAWEAWLEKEDKEIKKKPTMFPRIRREFEDEKDEDPMVYDNKTASWESWLEKEEKPKERDYLAEMQTQGEQNMYQNSSKKKKFLKEAKGAGKKIEQQMGENDLPLSYSNRLRTNIKRPAERVTGNDLSDLDGWVEETKSWESWLEKTKRNWDSGKDDRTPEEKERIQRALAGTVLGHFEDENPIKGVKKPYPKHLINPKDKNNATETSHKKDEKKDEWDGKFSSSTIRDDVKDDDDKAVSEEESLEELTDGKLEEVEKLKSWELWLNKYEETSEDKKLALQLDEARAVTGKKVATQKVKPETGEDAKMGEYSTITAEKFKSWTTWLEKMQGAGDARFGNQHLTGLDQKPVDNEEDEANILPEKEEKTDDKEEKQEKTEDKEDKDNKPYKALSQE